jgi:pimeloyl-ACP methyl ester carboxylesterase
MNFVLIPGAGGTSWVWHLVTAQLIDRGHQVIAPDLPAEDEECGVPEYTATVMEALGDCQDLAVVGLSLGAFTAASVALQAPVSLLVLLNAMIPAVGETPGQWWEATGQAEAQRGADRLAGRQPGQFDVQTYFFHDVAPAVFAEGASHNPTQSNGPFADDWSLERWPDVPTRVLSGGEDRFFPPSFQRRLAAERLGLVPEVIPGGHLVPLSRPTLVADRLEAYAAQVEGGT